jgi:hypothetical protein
MALCKEYMTRRGSTAVYHRVREVMFRDGRLKCVLVSYASKEDRELHRVLGTTPFAFTLTAEEEVSGGIRELCYRKIKESEAWADAEDC